MPKAELARRAGLRRETLTGYLSGKHPMTLGQIIALAGVFGVSRQDALDGLASFMPAEDSEK